MFSETKVFFLSLLVKQHCPTRCIRRFQLVCKTRLEGVLSLLSVIWLQQVVQGKKVLLLSLGGRLNSKEFWLQASTMQRLSTAKCTRIVDIDLCCKINSLVHCKHAVEPL